MNRPLIYLLAGAFAVFALCTIREVRSQGPATVALDQGWDAATSARYYHESQGAVLLPAAFLRALRTADGKYFLDPAHMRTLGFLPGVPEGNPYPLGVAIDPGSESGGVPMAGMTCAACHTSELQYRGTVVRIEGGSSYIDIPRFHTELGEALMLTAKDPARRAAFLAQAVRGGYPQARVAQGFENELRRSAFVAAAAKRVAGPTLAGGPGTTDAFAGIAFNAFTAGLLEPENARAATAPVRYPYLWDIWHFDWVQYNAAVRQPMGRNIGEDIGLGARLNIVDAAGRLNPEPQRWKSTVRIKSLYWMETALERLQAPTWPAAFGPIDPVKAARGRALFAANCAACHAVFKLSGSTSQEWHVPVIALDRIGTDPNEAVEFARTTINMQKVGLSRSLGLPEALAYVVKHVKDRAYIDAGIPRHLWPQYDGFGRALVIAAPCGYKARPLVGIWAAPPYLHNGSVPSLFDLLSQTRPARPILGNPEFDPVKVGMVQRPAPGSAVLDTSGAGRSNAGHWFTDDRSRKGRIGHALRDAEKYDIIEYLKSATYADYPSKTIASAPPYPCENRRDWAKDLRTADR